MPNVQQALARLSKEKAPLDCSSGAIFYSGRKIAITPATAIPTAEIVAYTGAAIPSDAAMPASPAQVDGSLSLSSTNFIYFLLLETFL